MKKGVKRGKDEVGQLHHNYQKKRTSFGDILKFSILLCDKNSLRYLNLLLVVLFFPHGTEISNKKTSILSIYGTMC